MKIDIHEILEYFAITNFAFAGAFFEQHSPQQTPNTINRRTNPFCGGIILPIDGCAQISLDGVLHTVKPGAIVHAGPNMQLNIVIPPLQPWHMAVLHYKADPAQQAATLFHQCFSFEICKNAKLLDIAQCIHQNQFLPGAGAKFKSKRLFIDFLGELFDSAEKYFSGNKTELSNMIMNYMHQNLAANIGISQIAAHFKMDRRSLAKLFRQYVGMPPSNYLIECRILKAKELLYASSYPIKQVAECVGYADSLFFSRTFKKHTGFSPSAYRQFVKNT